MYFGLIMIFSYSVEVLPFVIEGAMHLPCSVAWLRSAAHKGVLLSVMSLWSDRNLSKLCTVEGAACSFQIPVLPRSILYGKGLLLWWTLPIWFCINYFRSPRVWMEGKAFLSTIRLALQTLLPISWLVVWNYILLLVDSPNNAGIVCLLNYHYHCIYYE